MAQILLDAKADVDQRNQYQETCLHMAIRRNYISKHSRAKISKILLESGANVNLGDDQKRTPLHFAVRVGCLSTVKLLLDHGSEIGAKDKYGRTALMEAERGFSEKTKHEVVKFLKEKMGNS